MSDGDIVVTLRTDVNEIDETGYLRAFLSEASEPERIRAGALIVAGDPVEPFLARVVAVVAGTNGEVLLAPSSGSCSRSGAPREIRGAGCH